MPSSERIPYERLERGARVKAYILEVRGETKGPQIVVSRSHPEFVRSLFELEVPELVEGVVEMKAIAREPGHRTKIAVASNDPNVDPVGACVGARGSRVRQVVNELRGEKVDVVEWRADARQFIAEALSPAKVKDVEIIEDEQTAVVTVPDHQLSLAIGKEGQNARLAARLTGYRVDIRSESQAAGVDPEAAREEPAAEVAVPEAATEEAAADATDAADEEAATEEAAAEPANADEPSVDAAGSDAAEPEVVEAPTLEEAASDGTSEPDVPTEIDAADEAADDGDMVGLTATDSSSDDEQDDDEA